MEDTRVNEQLAWYRANLTEDYFAGAGGGVVRYGFQSRETGRGTIVILPGRTEFLEKYLEFCQDLQDCDYSICLVDHFGQGGSGRPLKDAQKGHIADFGLYVEDIKRLLARPGIRQKSVPVVLIAHSMGATIATLLAAACPHLVDDMILVSPMLQINTGLFLPPLLVETICTIACVLGKSENYVFGGGPFNPDLPFANNDLTADPARFKRNLQFVQQNNSLALGSPTFGWLRQAYRAMRTARNRVGDIACPVLIFQGTEDPVVGLQEMDTFCAAARSAEIIRYRDGRHELLMEADFIRNPLVEAIRNRLKQAD